MMVKCFICSTFLLVLNSNVPPEPSANLIWNGTDSTLYVTTPDSPVDLAATLKIYNNTSLETSGITFPANYAATWTVSLGTISYTAMHMAYCNSNGNCSTWVSFPGNQSPPPTYPLPTANYDWRQNKGNCTRDITILNQGQCGSCYVFSATTVASHRACAVYGQAGEYAPQAALSCSQDSAYEYKGNKFTCNGGWPENVFGWINQYGVTDTCCSPYNQKNGGNIVGKCPLKENACGQPLTSQGGNAGGVVSSNESANQFLGCANPPSNGNSFSNFSDFKVLNGFYRVGLEQTTNLGRMKAIMNDVKTNGPVVACFTVFESFYTFFNQNPTGVYSQAAINDIIKANGNKPDTKEGGHAVLILGYEQQVANGPWNYILQNSWGESWGDNGYFRIEAGTDLKGLETGCVGGVHITTPSTRKLASRNLTPADTTACSTNCTQLQTSQSSADQPGSTITCDKTSKSVQGAFDFAKTTYKWDNASIISVNCHVGTGTHYKFDLYDCGIYSSCKVGITKETDETFSVLSEPVYMNMPDEGIPFWGIIASILAIVFGILLLVNYCVENKKRVAEQQEILG